jgi:FkbM family methyltransferase
MLVTRILKHRLNEVLGRFGFEAAQRRPKLVDFLRSRKITTLLDVGANEGQFATGIRVRGYSGRMVSFEPTATAFAILQAKARADGRWEARHMAIGASDGRAELSLAGYSEFNSFLPATRALVNIDTRAASERVEEVEVHALDSIFEDFGGERVFLKSDTQGYEAQVLIGARRSLPQKSQASSSRSASSRCTRGDPPSSTSYARWRTRASRLRSSSPTTSSLMTRTTCSR